MDEGKRHPSTPQSARVAADKSYAICKQRRAMMKGCEEAGEAAAEPPKEAAAPAALPAASYTVGGATSSAGYIIMNTNN